MRSTGVIAMRVKPSHTTDQASTDAWRIGDRIPARRWGVIEIALGVVLLCGLAIAESRVVVSVWTTAVWSGVRSFVPLLRVDGAATSWSLALALARIGLLVFPSLVLMRASPKYRLTWLVPLVAMVVILSSPVSLAACPTIGRWLLMAIVSGVAAALTRYPSWRWAAALPFLLLWEVVPGHTFAPARMAVAAYREWLLAECARRDGTRPKNLTADHLMPFYGITALSDDLVLLTGEKPDDKTHTPTGGRRFGSWWLRRDRDGDFRFDQPSEATGNLWRGCVLDGTAWMARANRIVGATRLPDGAAVYEQV